MTDMVIMPGSHYQAICDAVRAKTGDTAVLKSGDLAAAIEEIQCAGENTIVPFIENTITTFSNEELTVIAPYGFAGKTELQSLYIPNVATVGGYAFESCGSLTEIHFEKHISIGTGTDDYFFFRGASNARKIEFNGGFSFIGSSTYAFYNLNNLEALIIRGDDVSNLNTTANFNGSSIEKGTGYIYVPAALVEEYKAATNWVKFSEQFRAIEDYPEITGGAV